MKTQIRIQFIKYSLLYFLFFGIGLNVLADNLLLEEDFDFQVGTDIVGKNDWIAGATSTNKVKTVSPGLTYTDYPNSSNTNAVLFTPTTDRVQKSFQGPLSGAYYYSFLIKVSSAGSGEFFIGLYSGSAFRGRAYIKADGSGFRLGLVKTTTGTVTYTTGTPLVFGNTYLVVVKYEFVPGNQNDIVSMFINPNLSQSEPDVPAIGPLTDEGNDVTANVFAIQGRNNSGNFILDGIRITANWSSIKNTDDHYVELPKFISSHMVLQRDIPLKFHGWGTPGDTIIAEFIRNNQSFKDSVKISEDKRWMILLPEQTACSQPCKLNFYIKNHSETLLKLDDILIGDVWFAGGQSNMEKKVIHLLEAEQYIAEADNYTQIRTFRAGYSLNQEPQEKVLDSSQPWIVCNSANLSDKVSAVAYVCARNLCENLNIPIGIMQSYRGGTEIETWISPSMFQDPELCKSNGRKVNTATDSYSQSHSINFNGQINPLVGFPIKGFLFYQGESNTKRALEYRLMMRKLVEDWRNLWGMGELPFYYVQLFNMSAASEYGESDWCDLREQQRLFLSDKLKNVGMAVTIETNEDPTNSDNSIAIHPRNKKPVGERLAKIALKNTYGFDLLAEGPVLNRYRFSNDTVYLYFKNYGDGLKLREGTFLKGFMISGSNESFYSATAQIINDSVVALKSQQVSQPRAVRYSWAKHPTGNLCNSENIPATPFKTDMWKSKVTYTSFPSDCSVKSSDANLLEIRINGVSVQGFKPQQLSYTVDIQDKGYQDVTALTSCIFAQVKVIENPAENKTVLKITSENGSVQEYEIKFKENTGIHKQKNPSVQITQEGKGLIITNTSDESYDIFVYNLSGQLVRLGKIKEYEKITYNIPSGLYYIKLTNREKEDIVKFLLKSI